MIYPYEGRKLAAERIVGKKENGYSTAAGRLCLRLLTNANLTLGNETVFADLTEASGTWYATRQFLATEWTAAVSNGLNNAIVSSPPVMYAYSGASAGVTIYAWALTTDPTLGEDKILFAGALDAPKQMAAVGDEFGLSLEFTSASLGSGLTLPNEGKMRLMDRLFGRANSQRNLSLRLFKNNLALAAEANLEDFTVANYSGYADQSITYTGWPSAVLNQSNRGQCSHASTNTFTHNGGSVPNAVYGYVVHEDGLALWAEKLPQAKSINQSNPFCYVRPRYEIGYVASSLAMTTGQEESLEDGIVNP